MFFKKTLHCTYLWVYIVLFYSSVYLRDVFLAPPPRCLEESTKPCCRSTEANGTTAAAATAASRASTATRPGSSRLIYTGFVTERGRPLECKRPRRSRSTAPSRRSTLESLTVELAQDGQCGWHKHRVNKQRKKN